MDGVFEIGGLAFRLIAPEGVRPPEHFMRFLREGAEPAYTYTIELTDDFGRPEGTLVARRPDLLVFSKDGLETRCVGMVGMPGFYACCRETDETHTTIRLARAALDAAWVDPMFVAMFALERRMAALGGVVLHCAYMARGDGAILFSAPSGTGKTTQATLWEKHRGTRVVNGDRALLRRGEAGWLACGWPVCGSSGVCEDENRPIRAVVMLSQGKENEIERLAPFQAFSQIYTQVTINVWNRDAQQRAMDLLERLVGEVPVYHLRCTISEDAVKCLEDALNADA